MNHVEILKLVYQLESELRSIDESWEEFFPILRAYLFFCFRSKHKHNKLSQCNKQLKTLLSVATNLPRSIYSLYRFRAALRENLNMIIAPALHRRISVNHQTVSNHMDSLYSHLNKENTTLLEIGVRLNQPVPKLPILNISIAIRLLQVLIPFSRHSNKVNQFVQIVKTRLENHCENKSVTLYLDSSYLSSWLYRYIFNVYFLGKFFPKDIALNKAIFVVYYDVEMFSLIAILNRRGVETIDYQHGIQNNHHPMYVGFRSFKNIPDSLPKHFWVWDEIAQNRNLSWSHIYNINTTIVGNLHSKNIQLENSHEKIKSKSTILIALQVWPEHFCFALFDVIQKYKHYHWLFREHPLYPLPESVKDEIKLKFPNVSFVDSKNVPAEQNISKCSICITGFSTMGVEAVNLGKKTIYTHKNALEGLGDYIDGFNIIYADNKESISDAIDFFMANSS